MKEKKKYLDWTKKGCHIQFLLSDIVKWCYFTRIWLWQRPKYKYIDKEAKKALKAPFMIVGNHQGWSDFLFMYYAWFTKRIWFMVTTNMFETKFKAWLYKRLMCVAIDPDNGSLSDMRTVIDVIKANNIVGIYPEGHINFKTSQTKDYRGGATLMALQTGIDTIPVYRERRKHWWQRQRIIIGKPYNVKAMVGSRPTREELDRVNKEIFEQTLELKRIYQDWVPAKKVDRNNIQVFVSPRRFESDMKVTDKERLKEIAGCKDEQSKLDKIYAWKVLEKVFKEEYGENINKLHLHKLDSGKWACDKYHISISHSGELIVVAIGKYNCGVDVQSFDEMNVTDELIDMTLNDSERNQEITKQYVVKNWSIKEAKYKLDGISGFLPKNMKVEEIENAETSIIVCNNKEYQLSVAGDTHDIVSYHFLNGEIKFQGRD